MDDGIALGREPESRALTGLRGVGAVLVMLHHFDLHLPPEVRGPAPSGLLQKGYLGVDLFFVLSGFVMAMAYGPWFAAAAPGRLRRVAVFLVRRVARLWPLHAAVIAVLVGQSIWSDGATSPRLVAINLALMQAWGLSAEINPPAWSISTEMLAYLLFPLLVPIVLHRRHGMAIGVLFTGAALAFCLALALPVGPVRRGPLDIYFNYSVLPVFRCLAGFVLGMVAWRAGEVARVRLAVDRAAGWIGPLALGLMLASMLGRVHDLLIYPLLPVIVLGLHRGRGVVWTGLARGPVYRLGVLSYAIYLVHVALLLRFPLGWASPPVELAAYAAAVLAAALVAHHAVERPGRRLGRGWGERLLAGTSSRPATLPLRGGPG